MSNYSCYIEINSNEFTDCEFLIVLLKWNSRNTFYIKTWFQQKDLNESSPKSQNMESYISSKPA